MRNTYYSEPIWNQPKQRLRRSCIDAKGQFDSAKVLRGTFTNRLLGQTGRAVTSFFVLLAWAISPSEVEPTPGDLVDYTILQYQFDYICKYIYIYVYTYIFLFNVFIFFITTFSSLCGTSFCQDLIHPGLTFIFDLHISQAIFGQHGPDNRVSQGPRVWNNIFSPLDQGDTPQNMSDFGHGYYYIIYPTSIETNPHQWSQGTFLACTSALKRSLPEKLCTFLRTQGIPHCFSSPPNKNQSFHIDSRKSGFRTKKSSLRNSSGCDSCKWVKSHAAIPVPSKWMLPEMSNRVTKKTLLLIFTPIHGDNGMLW